MLIAGTIYGRSVLEVSLTPLPPTIQSRNGHRNLVCLYWTSFLGLRYTWVKTVLKGPTISDLQGNTVNIGAQGILLEDFSPHTVLKFHLLSTLQILIVILLCKSIKVMGVIYDLMIEIFSVNSIVEI